MALISSARARTAAAICRRRSPVATTKRQGWRLVLEGAVVAARTRRSRTSRSMSPSAKRRTLRRGVVALAAAGPLAGHRRQGHDRAAPLGHQAPQSLATDVGHAAQVHVDHLVPVLGPQEPEEAIADDAGVADHGAELLGGIQ